MVIVRERSERIFKTGMQNTDMQWSKKLVIAGAALAAGVAAAMTVPRWLHQEPRQETIVRSIAERPAPPPDAKAKERPEEPKQGATLVAELQAKGFRKTYEFGIGTSLWENIEGNLVIVGADGEVFDRGKLIKKGANGTIVYKNENGDETRLDKSGLGILEPIGGPEPIPAPDFD